MTLERRQFLPTSAVNGQGLDRELTVDTSAQSLRVHTTSNPQGVILAKKSETDSLSSSVTSLGNTLASSVNNLQQQIDAIQPSNSYSYRFFGLGQWEQTASQTIRRVYPYSITFQLPLDSPLPAATLDGAFPMVSFDAYNTFDGKLASFCDLSGLQDSVQSDYRWPLITIFSKANDIVVSGMALLILANLVEDSLP